MKKTLVFCLSVCALAAFTSCGSSESAYKKAYEKAKAQEAAQQSEEPQTTAPVVTPLEQKSSTETTVVDNVDNAVVRQENYSAEGVQNTLRNEGYNPSIVFNQERNLYRVVAASYDSKADAVNSRNTLRAKYADAWLLYKK